MSIMTNEHVLITKYDLPVSIGCADAVGIEKGSVVKLSGSGVVALSNGLNDLIYGVTATEKIASSGTAQTSVYRNGRFKATLSGSAVASGDSIQSYGNNYVGISSNLLSGSRVLGYAVEACTTAGNTFVYELDPQVRNS